MTFSSAPPVGEGKKRYIKIMAARGTDKMDIAICIWPQAEKKADLILTALINFMPLLAAVDLVAKRISDCNATPGAKTFGATFTAREAVEFVRVILAATGEDFQTHVDLAEKTVAALDKLNQNPGNQ